MPSNLSSTTFIAGRRRQLGYVERATAEADSPKLLLRNLALLDPVSGTLSSGFEVLLAAGRIVEVSKGTISDSEAFVLDLGGRTLMPGLVDLHMHILGETLPLAPAMLPSLLTARATNVMLGMLARGFTTVRDAGGADHGHKRAVEMGYMTGPRLFVSGRVISQTGGHGDSRSMADQRDPPLCCVTFPGIGRIADGVDEVRKAVREELRLGADQIKVMAGGGIASQSDPIDQLQYSMEELEAVVDECHRSNKYVMAHVYTAAGVQRCVSAGVRTIEHGNLIDEKTARQMAEAGTYLVPTLAVYQTIKESGKKLNFSDARIAKLDEIISVGARSLELAQAAGVKIGFGTDVARAPDQQSTEFLLRAQVQKPIDIIRSATTVSAEVLRQEGKVGVIRPGALADLIAVDGNPLEDIGLLAGQGDHLSLIIAAGRVFKNSISEL